MTEKKMREIAERMIADGYKGFICGGAQGVDTDFAETVIALKRIYPEITLEIAVPCPNQSAFWSRDAKARYDSVLRNADKVSLIGAFYTPYCMPARNRYMVDNADKVIAFWSGKRSGGTYSTILYAEKCKKPSLIVNLSQLCKDDN